MALRLLDKCGDGQASAKVYRESDTKEYIVKYYWCGDYLPQADSFHTDREDALNTAVHQCTMIDQRMRGW